PADYSLLGNDGWHAGGSGRYGDGTAFAGMEEECRIRDLCGIFSLRLHASDQTRGGIFDRRAFHCRGMSLAVVSPNRRRTRLETLFGRGLGGNRMVRTGWGMVLVLTVFCRGEP
ncbi:MAG: hypothetical protein RL630_1756, partial [Verrucomicrobiota bacterium]